MTALVLVPSGPNTPLRRGDQCTALERSRTRRYKKFVYEIPTYWHHRLQEAWILFWAALLIESVLPWRCEICKQTKCRCSN